MRNCAIIHPLHLELETALCSNGALHYGIPPSPLLSIRQADSVQFSRAASLFSGIVHLIQPAKLQPFVAT